jgi:hypothetical protein
MQPGSFVDDGKGGLTPNMADKAMAARHKADKGTDIKKNEPAVLPAAPVTDDTTQTAGRRKREVSAND